MREEGIRERERERRNNVRWVMLLLSLGKMVSISTSWEYILGDADAVILICRLLMVPVIGSWIIQMVLSQ